MNNFEVFYIVADSSIVFFLASEKLPTDDLCKICMDAPIECVFLECGHMATCTACGKVLNGEKNTFNLCRVHLTDLVTFQNVQYAAVMLSAWLEFLSRK